MSGAVRALSVRNAQRSIAVDMPLLRQRSRVLLLSALPARRRPPALAVTVLSDAQMCRKHRELYGTPKAATTLAVGPPLPSMAALDLGDIWLGAGAVQRRSAAVAQEYNVIDDMQSWLARVCCKLSASQTSAADAI